MDDSCAVCADTLEWVAYGSCGHKEVCSTCVARLRFICDDRRCCICKTESHFVFVTKALGDYTRNIGDFSVFPTEVKEARVGSYWYHEDTQAFFDDLDHYKMIKAMCRLSCSVCDKMDDQPNDGFKRRIRFRNIDQLKGHLFHQHKLLVCSLCLEGRKVFICEQKLYTRAQLNQHISTGDSDVDGSENERGGFMGHPMCEFCRTPFYGDNELYTHMSTEHYTCHICQRQHPGQYEYYKNYDDLEIHFRRDHFLCEDENCLAKKFTVFQSETELKRHNAVEHGGHMSRSQRNAALQIPTSFRYRRYNEENNRRGRGRTFQRDTSETELSIAIQASLETANINGRVHDASSSTTKAASDHRETSDVDPLIEPLDSLAIRDSEPASRYLQALSQTSRNARLEESSFPPLSSTPGSNQQMAQADVTVNTMATHLRRQKNKAVKIPSSAHAWPAASRIHAPSSATPQRGWPSLSTSGSSSSSSQAAKPAIDNGPASSSHSSSVQPRHSLVPEVSPAGSFSSSRNWGSSSKIAHSASAPNLVQSGSLDSSPSDFPPVSAVQARKPSPSGKMLMKVKDVQTANKSLVERIRVVLNFDEDKYTAFKNISGEFRQGLMNAETYLVYVEQFGLSGLVIELASLCPDPQKQKELVDTYHANLVTNMPRENNSRITGSHVKDGSSSTKGKGKLIDAGSSTSNDDLTDTFMTTVRKLQSGHKPAEDDLEVLSKDGYRAGKGKVEVVVDEAKGELSSRGNSTKSKGRTDSLTNGGSGQGLMENEGKAGQRKKTSKFHRLRLGDDSAEATLDLKNTNCDESPDPKDVVPDGHSNSTEALPVRGVWRNGGGQKLLSKTGRGPKK